MNPQHPQLEPLVTVAAEIGADADVLAGRLAGAVELNAAGIRCIPTDTARQVIADHRAAVQAMRDRQLARRAEAARRPHPIRERVRALQRQQERFAGADVPALAVLMASDLEDRQAASSRRLDELLTGDSHYHRINEKD
jgi:hypothetical protein